MMKRRTFLLSMSILAGVGTFTAVGGLKHLNIQQAVGDENRDFRVIGSASLRDRAAAKGLIYGAAASYRTLSSNRPYAASFAQQCGILVPESELKWSTLRPSPDRFDFSKGDWLAKFAQEHKMLFRGHPLIWHDSLPEWFEEKVDSQNAKHLLQEHIKTVVGHYAGKVHSWDVVNEAIQPSDGRSDGLRQWPWLQLLGSDYIEIAFRAAAEADPQALLVYNDHKLDYDTEDEEARRTAALRLLERLKSRGVPVHALGMQAHLRADESQFNPKKLKAFLHDIASLGLKILITEMDVTDQNLSRYHAFRDRKVASVYEDYLSIVLQEPAVIAVLTWGISDRFSWLSKYKPRVDGASVRPLPFDAQMRRKLAWNAIARSLDKAPKRYIRLR